MISNLRISPEKLAYFVRTGGGGLQCGGRPLWKWVVILSLMAMVLPMTFFCSGKPTQEAWIDRNGKAWFFTTSDSSTQRFKLVVRDHEWHLLGDGVTTGNAEGGRLGVPFKSRFNDTRDLRFEQRGKVFLMDKASGKEEEIKRINGKWCYDADSHWQDFDEVWDDLMEPEKKNPSAAEKLIRKFLMERRPFYWEVLDSTP